MLPLVFAGKLYIAGGFDGTSCLMSAEMYDPLSDQWTVLAAMSIRRSGVSLVACDDRVFAIGGYDGQRRLESGTLQIYSMLFCTGPCKVKILFIACIYI